MTDYTALRRQLHDHPQTAGNECFAHDTIVAHLQSLSPTHVFTHVGGWGVVAAWIRDPGRPVVAFRADTDALPIGHRCGHDGHTAILMRLAELVDGGSGNALLLWQPAEETWQGALAVIESGVLQRCDIKAIYGLHNSPGYPLGTVLLRQGTFAAASTGIVCRMKGVVTHASTPELGRNPALAVAAMVNALAAMDSPGDEAFRQCTPICIRMGEPAFGTSAGEAEVMYTLRAFSNSTMQALLADVRDLVERRLASDYGLDCQLSLVEPFRAVENSAEHVAKIEQAALCESLSVSYISRPMRWSEDFAEYLVRWPGAFFGVGSGELQPELHNPAYDFPDAIIELTSRVLARMV